MEETTRAEAVAEEKDQESKQITQHEEKKKKTMKVLVAIDESEGSVYALKWTIEHLLSSSSSQPLPVVPLDKEEVVEEEELDRSVTVVHVQQTFEHYFFPVGPGAAIYAPTSLLDSVKKAQEENSSALLSKALRMCEERGVKKKVSMVLEGDPKDMICHAVEQIHPDLLVMGSRGLGKVKRAFLGSVSDYCAHHAKCNVLIVKAPQHNNLPPTQKLPEK